jgi:hypothetical protein
MVDQKQIKLAVIIIVPIALFAVIGYFLINSWVSESELPEWYQIWGGQYGWRHS